MITITCTNCQTLLEIDDAFAGGVCRCRHCGTIQTVPALARRPSRPGAPGEAAVPAPANHAYAAVEAPSAHAPAPPPPAAPPGGVAPSGTGLDEIAAAVASSGLVGTGLTAGRLRRGQSTGPASASVDTAAKQKQILAIVGGGAGVLLFMGILLGYALSGGKGPDHAGAPKPGGEQRPGEQTPEIQPKPPAARPVTFLGIPVKGPTVVYLIDRGAGTSEVFGELKDALGKSLRSLKADTRFQVAFWDVGSEPRGWRQGVLVEATGENVEAALTYVADTSAFGASSFERPLREALKLGPAEIFFVSGKLDLSEADVRKVRELRASSGGTTRIHALAVGANSSPEALEAIAGVGGGRYSRLDSRQMRDLIERP